MEWFEPWTGSYEPPYEEPSVPRLRDIAVDAAGLLWVLLTVPARDFSPLPRPVDFDLLAPIDSASPAFDTVIEVLDPEARQVVARRRFANTVLRGFLRGRHVVFYEVSESGLDQVFRIAALTLEDPR